MKTSAYSQQFVGSSLRFSGEPAETPHDIEPQSPKIHSLASSASSTVMPGSSAIADKLKPAAVLTPQANLVALPIDHWLREQPAPVHPPSEASEPLMEAFKAAGNKFTERFNIGWKNMSYLNSAHCRSSKLGRIVSKLDVPFLILGFVPFLHFFWLLQPSLILFSVGAIFKHRIGHEFLQPH